MECLTGGCLLGGVCPGGGLPGGRVSARGRCLPAPPVNRMTNRQV